MRRQRSPEEVKPPAHIVVPETVSSRSFLRMSEWLINTGAVLYRDNKPRARYAWYEGSSKAPLWVAVTGYAKPRVAAECINKRPPLLQVSEFEVFVRDDGTEFSVVGEIDMPPKDELALSEDPFSVDAFHIMRGYCMSRHIPVEQDERVLRRIEFDTLRNSGPLDL
ncbi:MAG TPA: hypothetical protein VLE74_03320 [Candidatus Saccharimonadales bacterium]|nr:hypothetical protein [Candidatus Saccharimonadales bacterium]